MVIGVLDLEIDIHHAESLKDKRAVLNRLKDRLRKKFNISIAEVSSHDVWNYANLGIVVVSNEQRFCNQVLSKIVDSVEPLADCVIADYSMDYIQM
jgi:uncharacterized protein YlxP (DUF503 family)